MEPLIIKSSSDTPSINFDSNTGILEISGRSLPEDSESFYLPVIKWVNEYTQIMNGTTDFCIKLDYFNTSTEKQLYRILSILEKMSKVHKVNVSWHFDKRDADMYDSAMRFSKLTRLKIEMVEF